MSRLDSAIRRLQAQRACLERGIAMIASLDGPVVELGLGNGRSYDHLRARLPGREIYVLDRQIAAHPDCVPDDDHMILGDFRDTLPSVGARIGAPAALVHCDIGSGVAENDRALAAFVADTLPSLLAPGAIVISDQPLPSPRLKNFDPPAGVAPGRYHLYRAEAP